jgi:hypothetical protein
MALVMEWHLWDDDGERVCVQTPNMDWETFFEKVYNVLVGEGGDGDMAVVFSLGVDSHKTAANEFEAFLEEKDPKGWRRQNGILHHREDIFFLRDQELFVFSDENHFCDYAKINLTNRFLPCSTKVIVYESI